MLRALFFGLLLGWGAAIPIGPINLEIVRRNLRFGTTYGMALGLGACGADITYLALLSFGALTALLHPLILNSVAIAGSFILAWFGYSALRMKAGASSEMAALNRHPLWRHTAEGYVLTLLNPLTILFWASISAQVIIFSRHAADKAIYAGIGVLLGTLSWMIALNVFLHLTRHRLSKRVMIYLNYAGGIILLGFAAMGFLRVIL
jgi:L-lysine exporter family protein LysE/ArgO